MKLSGWMANPDIANEDTRSRATVMYEITLGVSRETATFHHSAHTAPGREEGSSVG